jgi:hypothetical protein
MSLYFEAWVLERPAAERDRLLRVAQGRRAGRRYTAGGIVCTLTTSSSARARRRVLITTMSALGRSSIYNRLKYKKRELYQRAGYTCGYGHFQFSDELFAELRALFSKDGGVPSNRSGSGPNWRMRTLRTALVNLNLDPDLLHHRVGREVFLAPLAGNWKKCLLAEAKRRTWYHYDFDDMAQFYRERRAVPRAARNPSYRATQREAARLCDRCLTRAPRVAPGSQPPPLVSKPPIRGRF